MGGDGGKYGAGDGEAQSAEGEDQNQAPDDACEREVVEDGEDRDEDEFGERHEYKIGENFSQEDCEAGDGEEGMREKIEVWGGWVGGGGVGGGGGGGGGVVFCFCVGGGMRFFNFFL